MLTLLLSLPRLASGSSFSKISFGWRGVVMLESGHHYWAAAPEFYFRYPLAGISAQYAFPSLSDFHGLPNAFGDGKSSSRIRERITRLSRRCSMRLNGLSLSAVVMPWTGVRLRERDMVHLLNVEPPAGVEPATHALQWRRSAN